MSEQNHGQKQAKFNFRLFMQYYTSKSLSISFKVKLMVAQTSSLFIHCVKHFILPTWAIKIKPYVFVRAVFSTQALNEAE